MFANPRDAKNLQWHAIGRKNDGKLRHPADSPQWRNIDRSWPEFGTENRNLRLGLCTDGMNPHGNMSSRHSTWPVLLAVYNLPPWLCMKRKYIMLSLLISGPKQPGNDIDVYLAPLIEDLKILWNDGVPVYDAYSQSSFTLRAMIFCTVNDFPAYGNLSGYTNKGAKTGVARLPLSGHAVYGRVKNVDVAFGKMCKTTQKTLWKKRSIFWDLPYLKHLAVRHCLDVMHIEKNVCDSIIGTLLNIQGKTKDGIKVRKDMVEMGIRENKVVDIDVLDALQAEVVVTLCQLEIYIGILKGYVRNKYRPEGSIIEGYSSEEAIEFCTDYLAGVESIGVPKPLHEGKLSGKGTIGYKSFVPPTNLRDKAHHLVLEHLTEVHPYLDQHMSMIRQQNPSKGERWVAIEHNRTFIRWFNDTVMEELSQVPNNFSETIKWLSFGPTLLVSCYEGYDINGYTFYTKRQDEKSVVQNSGVTLVAISKDYSSAKDTKPIDVAMSYYGVIEEIWELDYNVFKIPLFRCNWVDNRRGVQIDELGFTLVDFSRLGYHDEPFILASQAKQVFYVSDPVDNKWSIVLQGKRSIVGVGDVDEEEYDHFDENPPLSIGIQSLSSDEDNLEISYMRSDHEEGLWVDQRAS
ncbi:PREDICTED: uncharacterized protein LOC109169475 [Ipomoea nil]|uniref:uncharacterized protein LOC109169475 n=1 Tax=Ipomoea nil TaxID=35883 RepID=UPI000901A997|nr:PREDICTED: uncharacterized protein LOC109169475 [Ipomoea nil]